MRVILPKPVIKIERWRYSKLYGIYVSNLGRFRNKQKIFIKPMMTSGGYLAIKLKYGTEYAHRIVAAVWLPTEDMYHLTVDHLDHNKRNNEADNLEWVTKKENLERAKEDMGSTPSINISCVRMFADALYQTCLKEFISPQEASEYVKKNHGPTKNAVAMTPEIIAKKISGFASTSTGKGFYCGYYWYVVKG